MAFNGVGMAFGSCSRVVFGVAIVLFLCNVSTSAPTVSASSEVTTWSEELQFARPEGWEIRHVPSRSLLQSVVPTSNGSLVLAADRTHRRDILHGFKYYTGGWNIKNQSYWSVGRSSNFGASETSTKGIGSSSGYTFSVAHGRNDVVKSVGYTGLPGFILALIWLALGLILLTLLCCCCCCCRQHMKREHDHGALGYYIPLVLLLLFSAAAIAGCYVLFWGQQKFHNELEGTLNYVVNQSRTTVGGLNNVSSYLSSASAISVEGTGLPTSEKQQIQTLNAQIASAASGLQNKTDSNAQNIHNAINNVRLALIIVSGVMLLLVLLGLVFSACGIRSVVYFLVVVGWILVVCTWILCGIFIMLQNVMGDTCVSMGQWVANPSASTSLDAVLPCVNPETGASTLAQSKATAYTLTSTANTAITSAVNNNNNRLPAPLWYNQSGPAVPALCNPYGPAPNYSDVACAAGSIDYASAPTVWAKYICPSSNGICTGTGRLTQDLYNQLTATANVSYGLRQYGPFLVDLQDCTTVRNTFTEITTNQCPGLRKYTRWVWIGLAIVSAGSMLSILLWMIYIRRRNMRYGRKNRNLNQKAAYGA